MANTTGPNLGLFINGEPGNEHFSLLMAQFRGLDLLVQPVVKDKDLNAPPGSPADGDSYIVGSAPTGAWATHATHLARWAGVAAVPAWEFYIPKEGWRAYVQDEDIGYFFNGASWASQGISQVIGLQSALDLKAGLAVVAKNIVVTSYTLILSDSIDTALRFNNGATITVTIPSNGDVTIPGGRAIPMRQVGAGKVSLSPGLGVTLNTPTGYQARSARQGSSIMIHKAGTDEWDLTGDLEPV